MLPLPSFELHRPTTVTEALELLSSNPDAKVISGGTDLLPSMKHGIFKPSSLVSTRRIEGFNSITQLPDGVEIGAGVTHRQLIEEPSIEALFPALVEACDAIATPTIQSMGTIGGNILLDTRCRFYNQTQFWRDSINGCLKCDGDICHVAQKGNGCYAAHSADTVPVLMLLNAEVVVASNSGERRVPIAELYSDDGRSSGVLEQGELLTKLFIPTPDGRLHFRKLRVRQSIDYPLLVVAIKVSDSELRVVVSGVGPAPIEIIGANELRESGATAEVPALARKMAKPLGTHNVSPSWRRAMVEVEVRRGLVALGLLD